jgi:clan AA aspartic protease (TIGR02281 family)
MAMRHLILTSLIVTTLLLPATLLWARIYIWTDAEGVKHFSQEPPPENATEIMVKDEVHFDASLDAKQQHTEQPVEQEVEAAPMQSPKPSAAAKRQQTRIVLKGNVILVPTTLIYGGRQIDTHLVLDTGASSTVLHAPLAKRLGIQPKINTQIRVASGEMVNAQAVNMDAIRVGPHKMQGMRTLIIRHQGPQTPHQGLLGLNFLSQFPYSVDMRSMVINWGTQIPAAGP